MKRITSMFNYVSKDGRAGGFSESWYYDGGFDEAFAVLASMNGLRMQMAHRGVKCVGSRVTDLINPATVANSGKSRTDNRVFVAPRAAARIPDVPQMATSHIVDGTGVDNTKRFMLRCCPDPNAVEGGFEDDGAYLVAFSAWLGELAARNVKFRCIDLTKPRVKVASIANDGTFVLLADLTYNVGDYITVYRVRNTAGVATSGSFSVEAKTDSKNGKLRGWTGGVVGISGELRVRGYTYPVVKDVGTQFKGITVGKVGRPFGQYRGRARR